MQWKEEEVEEEKEEDEYKMKKEEEDAPLASLILFLSTGFRCDQSIRRRHVGLLLLFVWFLRYHYLNIVR